MIKNSFFSVYGVMRNVSGGGGKRWASESWVREETENFKSLFPAKTTQLCLICYGTKWKGGNISSRGFTNEGLIYGKSFEEIATKRDEKWNVLRGRLLTLDSYMTSSRSMIRILKYFSCEEVTVGEHTSLCGLTAGSVNMDEEDIRGGSFLW